MKIMAIGAHSDDVEIGCGGTIARAIREGHEATIIVVTEPAGGDRPDWHRETLDAATVLGADIRTLRYEQDSYILNRELITDLSRLVRDIQPDIVFAMWRHDTHQDHRITCKATLAASRDVKMVLTMEGVAPARLIEQMFTPRAYIRLTEKDIAIKIKAIEAHRSQADKYGAQWAEGMKARAMVRGAETNAQYAEAFDVVWQEVGL